MTWTERPLIGFDLETTGVDPETARIVTAAVVFFDNGECKGKRQWLVNPGIEIPEEASAIHGVTTEMARKDGEVPFKAVPEIASTVLSNSMRWVNNHHVPLVVFNAAYDLTVLDRELKRIDPALGLDDTAKPVIDPLVIDRELNRYRKGKRTLTDLCAHYEVELLKAHTSDADAVAAGLLALAMAQEFPEMAEAELVFMHNKQEEWYRRQSESFHDYLVRLAGEPENDSVKSLLLEKAALVNGDWPIKPIEVSVGS